MSRFVQQSPGELTHDTFNDPEILRISRATTLIDDDEMTARSVAQRWAEVTLVLQDGTRLTAPPGTLLSDAEISAKFHSFADPVWGPRPASEVTALCAGFDKLDAAEFARLLDLLLTPPFPGTA